MLGQGLLDVVAQAFFGVGISQNSAVVGWWRGKTRLSGLPLTTTSSSDYIKCFESYPTGLGGAPDACSVMCYRTQVANVKKESAVRRAARRTRRSLLEVYQY